MDTPAFYQALSQKDFEAAKAILKTYQDTFWAEYCAHPRECEQYKRFRTFIKELLREEEAALCEQEWAEIEERGWEQWDESFTQCNINRAMHEKMAELLPLYFSARIERREEEADAWGLIISSLSYYKNREAMRCFLHNEFVDNPYIPQKMKSILVDFLNQEWFN